MTDTPPQTGVQIRDIGCFFAGGRIVTLTGQPKRQIQVARNGPSRMVDMNGDYVTGQCYVQYVRQMSPTFDAPVMFWHGGGMTGVTWETTPDGRPGWRSYFLNAGFDTCVCDAMERGRAGWSPYPDIYSSAPIFRTLDEAWYMYRIGEPQTYAHDPDKRKPFPGTQFPVDSFDTLGAQLVPRWTDHGSETLDAYYDALGQVGPVWLIAHSQGGNLALEAAATRPELFKGVVVIEPAAAPPDTGGADKVPHLFVWGDNMDQQPIWVAYRQVAADYVDRLRDAGGSVDLLDLPVEGIRGNSHLPMMDRNCEIIAEKILNWIRSR